ncbi:putative flavin carrier protein 3 [Elasticomyces elasticus]|nr:putative flavin carrier protein 3 [Elasticomyces elasticus]
MRFSTSPATYVIASLLAFSPFSSALRMIESSSLTPCQANSSFSATLFNVLFTPDNKTLFFNIVGVSSITGNVTAELLVIAYGYQALKEELNPCALGWQGLCPMNTGQIRLESNIPISDDVLQKVPGITYTIPDLDGKVQVFIKDANTGVSVACVEAELSNGKTVNQKGVGWATAVIAGLGLIASAITSGLGHSNTAAHIAANALSLFGYFQGQALMGMTAVPLPPIVASWTQNFQWSMGIIRIGFLQSIATWYQRATGGTPSSVLSDLATTSVSVQKRSLDVLNKLYMRAYHQLHGLTGRATGAPATGTAAVTVIHGIKRVGFTAGIELTNIFLTGYAFFVIFTVFVILVVVIFKLVCEGLVRAGRLKGDKFQDFRNGWTTVLKGILFRIVLISFTQMVVLCFWELTVRDSGAEVVLAIFTIFTMLCILVWASSKVIRLARRSIAMHKNPAYILYSDPVSLNKWGFLYVQYKATAYYFVVPVLCYLLAKGMFVALSQGSAVVQAIALVILDAVLLIVVCIIRPYMDKKTNAFNIAICIVNFISAVFLLIFTDIFNQPAIVTGIIGIIFFLLNVVFSFVLLLMVLISSIIAMFSKNPDTRYQPMRDDRGSFIKSQSQLTTELDALGATARGEEKAGYRNAKAARIEDDDDSWSSGSLERQQQQQQQQQQNRGANAPRGPSDLSVPTYPNDSGALHGPPSYRDSPSGTSSPAPGGRAASVRSDRFRTQGPTTTTTTTGPSPWQRGAGYEH